MPKKSEKYYYMMYKPRGYITTTNDERGRKTVMDLIADVPVRVYPVGRLDKDSEGLLLLTNDGDFANLLTHPSHGVSKLYRVTVRPHATEEQIIALTDGVVLDDGLFLACESSLKHKAVMRSNFSSAVAGGEGLFNLSLNGSGVFCIESECPKEELIEITLQDDVLKVDGNHAIAWSKSLEFTVERSGKTLIGSAASGEGLVNVYRGTGKVLMMPTAKMINI